MEEDGGQEAAEGQLMLLLEGAEELVPEAIAGDKGGFQHPPCQGLDTK